MAPTLDHPEPTRLAAAVALAGGSVSAAHASGPCHGVLAALCELVDATRGAVVLEGAGQPHATFGPPPSGPESVLRLPLVAGHDAVGTVEVARTATRPFSPADRMLVEIVSPRLTLWLECDRLVSAESEARAAATSARAERRLAAEHADDLEETSALHKAVVETIVDGIVVIDASGRMVWANRAAHAMFGYAAAEVIGHNVSLLMPTHESGQHDDHLQRYRETGERRIIGIGREVRGRRKDGTEFPLYLAVGETTVNGERKFTGILRDLSEQRELERLLQERQMLARVGELAAIVAHEVRNPLAAIRGVVEVIQTRFAPESSDRRVLGDLLARVSSLDDLVGDLLVYARPAPPTFGRVSVLALVRDTINLLDNDPASSHLGFEVSGDETELWLDAAQMSRAVFNLMTNAAQAMRHQGVVRVTGQRAGDRYRLRFSDAGPGMPDDVRARCLEPFFTTKTRGTGLGLPIARRVVEEHGGHFTIASLVGSGTEVTIDLPVAARENA